MAEAQEQPSDLAVNRLLAALPRAERDRLTPRLEAVTLPFKQVLYEPNQPIPYVYFITSGVASLVQIMDDGAIAEVSTVGNEGMVGLPVFLGADSTPSRCFMQIPGEGLRLPAEVFRHHVTPDSALHGILQRYTQALMVQMAQGVACNRLHSIDERCCRWLLQTHDRVHEDRFPLTQEFLSQMLGVRRPSVSTVAGMLQQAGLIRYSRGVITIVDRHGLEAGACECYRIIRAEYDRLFS